MLLKDQQHSLSLEEPGQLFPPSPGSSRAASQPVSPTPSFSSVR
jgi:hypothetical protein